MDQEIIEGFTSIQDATVQRGTAIVAEGGGQRGIFTAGVLDAFLSTGFNPFELAIGASAGAQNLSSYFVSLPGYARRAIAELSASPSFLVPYRWLGNRSVIDLDMYFARITDDPDYRFPSGEIDRLAKQRRLLIVATDTSDLQAIYMEPDSSNLVMYMKASSAVPFLYKGGVPVHGRVLVDGGVADPVPVQKACDLGARRILVIRTVPTDFMTSCWRQRLNMFGLVKAMPSNMLRMLESHEQAYEEALYFMQRPPAEVEIVQIAPEAPLKSQVFGSRSDALMHDYVLGRRAGESILGDLHDWLELDTPALSRAAG